jgi:RNA polymerase sigma-70 factor, ECF subfamily
MMLHAELNTSDAGVIERSRDRPEAFAELYDRHAPAIFQYVARRLGRQAAEDLIAEAFLVAFRRRDRYDSSRPDARPWLYGIAANLIGKHRRAEVRMLRALARTGVDPLTDGDAERADDRIAAGGLRRELAGALAALPAENREVLLLVAWADLSYEEVGCALGIPIGTVRSRLSRARRRVRGELARLDRTSLDKELSNERA